MNCIERFISEIDKTGVAVKVLTEEDSVRLLTVLEENNIVWGSGNKATYRKPRECYIVIRPVGIEQSVCILHSRHSNFVELNQRYLVFSSVDHFLNAINVLSNINLEVGDLL